MKNTDLRKRRSIKAGMHLRLVNIHEVLALCGQPEELEGPLLAKHEVPYRIAHYGGLGYLSVAHVEVFFQDFVDLPALHVHAEIVLQNPPNFVCAANVICLMHHLLYHLLDG
jgi:hypothetical protein